MTNENAGKSNNDQTTSEAEILLSRIVDQQATEQDQHRFEQLADKDASLWQTLAQQQQDMAALSNTVIEQLVESDLVELPTNPTASLASTITLRPLAFVGWAAAIIIAVVWLVLPVKEPDRQITNLSADEYFQEYRKAEFVKQELDPILMDWERIDDEWIRIYIMRRIEESFPVHRPLNEITDGEKLIVTPEELRKDSSPPPTVIDQ